MTENENIIKKENINFIETEKTETIYVADHIDPSDELKFFLKEYHSMSNEKFDYYYIIPVEWFKKWDYFMSNPW